MYPTFGNSTQSSPWALASKLHMSRCILLTSLLVGSALCLAQETKQSQVSCEPTNNTSGSPRYRGSKANAPPGNVSKLPLRSLLYKGSQTRIFTRYMPWFGDPKHRDVGYRSNDREQVSRHVADKIGRASCRERV